MSEAVDVKRGDGVTARVPPATDTAGAAPLREVEVQLYAKRQEIYPRQRIGDSLGRFQTWRWVLVWVTQVIFYGLPWLQWPPRRRSSPARLETRPPATACRVFYFGKAVTP